MRSEPADCPNEDNDDIDDCNVRDALIRKYSYKQAMCLGAFSSTVNQYSMDLEAKIIYIGHTGLRQQYRHLQWIWKEERKWVI